MGLGLFPGPNSKWKDPLPPECRVPCVYDYVVGLMNYV